MSLELCEMAFNQTLELLRVTDQALQEMRGRKFVDQQLYIHAIEMILGAKGKRGPTSIFLVFKDDSDSLRGSLFQSHHGELVEMSDEIVVEPSASFSPDFTGSDAVFSNWCDTCETVDDYQRYFPSAVRTAINAPIVNFVAYRISGEKPGEILAFNYPGEVTDYDAKVLKSLAIVISSLVTLSAEMHETENAFIYTVETLARACEAAEEGTGKHIVRVNQYAGTLAANLGLTSEFVEAISHAAQMHDVGKIRVPATILLKEGRLSSYELELIRMHPVYGEQILGDSPRLELARQVAIAHHENWDGSGYPHHLAGEAIPLAGRIVKIADVYDALRSQRSYKPAYTHAEALEIFRNGDSRISPAAHFDPRILEIFFKVEPLFARIYESFADEEAVKA